MGTTGCQALQVTMKSFVLSSIVACALAAPTTHVNEGLPAGPLTPAFGDAVQTPKGLRSFALEGFSEDLNQDGFVDPIGQAVVAAPVAYAVPHVVAAPQVYAHNVAVNTVAAPHVVSYAAAPHVVQYAAPVTVKEGVPASTELLKAVAPVVQSYAVPHVQYAAAPHLQYAAAPHVQYAAAPVATHVVPQVFNYAPFAGVPFLGGVAPVAAPAVAPAAVEAEAPAVEAV